MTSRHAPTRLLVLAAAVLLSAATCSDDPEPPPRPAPTTTAPATTQSRAEADEAALRKLADDWFEVAEDLYREQGSGRDASEFLVDPYLEAFTSRLEAFQASGNSSIADPRSAHEVGEVVIAGDTATIEECIVDADAVVDATGTTVNDEVATVRYTTTAVRTEDGWRFSERVELSERMDVETCES